DEYEARLRDDGMVIADFAARRAAIEQQLAAEAEHQGALLGDHEGLLDEVTALVEHPAVYAGAFDPAYLALPQECLILTMRQNQKYFPLFDAAGKLLPKFLMVSNMRVADPRHIVSGNERVVRPRLEDARFFYEQDRKIRLEARVPQLAKVVYHNKLGTQLERVERLQLLAGRIARELKADAALAERAAWLSKADLLTGMVGEFPELQGTMGRYYALYDGESREVAHAIEAHYRPRFAGDGLPAGDVARIVALADKLDALVGMFSIGGAPTGEKDPFGLRRAALGVLRILIEAKLPLELPALLVAAAGGFTNGQVPDHVRTEVYDFALERLRHYLREQGYAADEIESVVSQAPQRIDLVTAKLDAVRTFRQMPEAGSLAEANKRIRNILRKSEATYARLDASLLREKEERDLYKFMQDINQRIALFVRQGDYTATLTATATVQPSVAAFFDKVMVNAEDAKLRANRHALLKELGDVLNQVADISKLAQ
ncbi:MAG TPA: glycine--tRNA ligase subunit beta, partial [Burkholderiales bacterium]|nr:glycine--tRNA ligase subunit beta [Burkholderiales bacterium]